MIIASLADYRRYTGLHHAFPRAFEFLLRPGSGDLASERSEGRTRHVIDGERIWASIDDAQGRGHDRAQLEAHRRYIDIQFTIQGDEEIGWKPVVDCAQPAAFDESKDIGFFSDRPESWLSLPAGHFAVFFPEDAHAPLAGRGAVRKAILKIAIE